MAHIFLTALFIQPAATDTVYEDYSITDTLTIIGSLATPTGIEPVISSVTGWHDNHLRYGAI